MSYKSIQDEQCMEEAAICMVSYQTPSLFIVELASETR